MGKIFFTFLIVAYVIYCPLSLFLFARLSNFWKLTGMALCLCIFFKWAFYGLFGGNPWLPQISWPATVIVETLFNAFVISVPLLIAIDLCGWGWTRLHGGHFPWLWAKIGALSMAFMLGAWGFHEAVKAPEVITRIFHDRNLPKALSGFKIVQLSDLHLQKNGMPERWIYDVVNRVNELKPDLILITGDFYDGNPEELERYFRVLGRLKASHGVYGVSGNHDVYYNYGMWLDLMRESGLEILENRTADIRIGNAVLSITGIADSKDTPKGAAPQKTPSDFSILMIHQPKNAMKFRDEYSLVLSGHTHGGQVAVAKPLAAQLNGGMARGFYGNIHVSPGTGLWRGMSLRLGVPPEITEIILEP